MSLEKDVIINNKAYKSFVSLWPEVEKSINDPSFAVRGTVVHGDYCLSNILYDMRSRVVKFIDPRGSFGEKGIYGDPRYDVAKLYHSVYGLYDFMVQDLFRVSINNDQIELELAPRSQHKEINKRFEKVFFADFSHKEVLLITALLFLSMPALHYDHPNRQVAMFSRGIMLLNEWSTI